LRAKEKALKRWGCLYRGPPSNVEQSVALNNGENMEAVWNEYGGRLVSDAEG
jgi:hypothetical protein